jgi:hypothetical protein
MLRIFAVPWTCSERVSLEVSPPWLSLFGRGGGPTRHGWLGSSPFNGAEGEMDGFEIYY